MSTEFGANKIMTMDLFGDSDVESFSEISSDDQDDIFSIYSGHAQSILSNLEDSIEKIDDYLSFDRGFTHGDNVRSVGNPSGQMGKVVNIKMFVDLENVFGEVIKDVNSEKLLRMRSYLVGDYVIHGPWLGRVEKVVDNVSIIFDDGTKCEILATDQAQLMPLSPNLLDDSLYAYHPGQRVRIGHPTGSKSAGWLCRMSKKIQHEGTVVSAQVGIAYIDWISSAMVGLSMTIPPPTRLQDPKNLTLLSDISRTNWHLGDWCVLPYETRLQSVDLNWNFDEIFSIVKKKSKVDVMWQDGSCSLGLDSHTLIPVSVLNAHEFFPEQFVLEKTNSYDLVAPVSQRWGVVRSFDANERTVKVKWESTDAVTEGIGEWKMEETVSAYELVEHPDFSFNIGDIVFLSDKNHLFDLLNKLSMVGWTTLRSENCNSDLNESQKRHFLSCIGFVVGFKNGDVEVEWASGVTSKVAPYKILCMEKDDGSVATHIFQEGSVAESGEMADYERRQSVNHQNLSNPAVNCQSDQRSSCFFSLSQAAMGFFTSIAVNFFGSHGTAPLPQLASCANATNESDFGSFDEEDNIESSDIDQNIQTMKTSDFDANGTMNLTQKVDRNPENVELLSAAKIKDLRQFKQFDLVGDCSDHHFADTNGKGAGLPQMKKGWLKKVQQEWSILEKDLSDTIYLRIYEERMDLLRVAIIGAPGTPYHDGLFFFDLLIPSDYPHVPPLVHYHSGGLRINPNLYESGKVCLSLLNTWIGTGSEVWNPGSSTILQVLLSLQALVLNAKPYFNEAGYDKQIGKAEGENNSLSYNENAYLGTCKSMLYHLRKPMKHFEELVNEHFERRSLHILSACKTYMEGTPIGFVTKAEHEKGNSLGFKIMLAKLFPMLVQAFTDKGIDCSQFMEPEK